MEVITAGNKRVELPAIGRSILETEDIVAMDIVAVVAAAGTAIDIKSAFVADGVEAEGAAVESKTAAG